MWRVRWGVEIEVDILWCEEGKGREGWLGEGERDGAKGGGAG